MNVEHAFCFGPDFLFRHLLNELLWKLPSKRDYPNYYKEVKNPLSLSQFMNKLKVAFISLLYIFDSSSICKDVGMS